MLKIGADKCGIYVIHALKNYDHHEKHIRSLFAKHSLEFEFVSDGDPSFFTDQLLQKYLSPQMYNQLSRGVVSCALNHILTYEKVIKNENDYAIIFEDDVFFLGDFKLKLLKIWPEIVALEKGFIISLENTPLTLPSFWQAKRGKYLYRASRGRMAAAYIVDYKAAEIMLNDLKNSKCDTALDWWHNILVNKGLIKMYWAHPPLVEQGSHNGLLYGTISTKPKSLKRRIKWIVQKIYKYYIIRLFNDKRIIE